MSSISSSFTFLAQSAKRHLGGLAIVWNPIMLCCQNSWGASFGIGLEIFEVEENLHLNLINIYGPCNGQVAFWESIQASQFLKKENVIIRGDLNFTIGTHEIWGPNARVDP